MNDTTTIRSLCQHRWPDIFRHFGIDEKFVNGRHQPCPLCGGTDRARFTNHQGYGNVICNGCCPPDAGVDGFEFLQKFTRMGFKEIADEIRSMLGDTTVRVRHGTDVSKTRTKLTTMWKGASVLAKGDPVHRYLISRGLKGLAFGSLQNLRYHPSLPYWDVEGDKPVKIGEYPCMLGMVMTPEGTAATLHVTYLQADGTKADVVNVRKTMTPAKSWDGGAVRLEALKEGQVLCVAEGIETALSMKLHFPECCPWACINEGQLQKFIPPNDESATIYIAADADTSYVGQAAAYALAKRLSGKHSVSVLMPTKLGTDWLDELRVAA